MTNSRLNQPKALDHSTAHNGATRRHPLRRVLAVVRRGWDDTNYVSERLLDSRE